MPTVNADVVLTLKQTVTATPLDPKNTPYLMIYEADKDVWNDKGLGPDKKLDPIVSIQGNFGDDGVFSVAKTIAQKAPLAIRLTKAALLAYGQNLAAEGPLVAELSQAVLFETEDKREGMTAFLEKRPPHWRGK